MKKIKRYILPLCMMLGFASCENDGDLIYVSPLDDTQLSAMNTNIVLSPENNKQIVLSLAWTGQDLVLSDQSVSLPDILSAKLAVSLSEDMSDAIESIESSNSKAYTGFELNTVAKNLDATPDKETSFFFQMKTSAGANMEPELSNIVEVKVTPYLIDMTHVFLTDKDYVETGSKLYSENTDGIYKGFVGATAWMNFYMKEGDGKVWGNKGEAGVEFYASSDEDTHWNFWFPGKTGCYYSILNTVTTQWSANFISGLNVSGDIEGAMTYDRQNNKWIFAFEATGADLNIAIDGDAFQYDVLTQCDDELAVANTIGFSGSSSNLEFGQNKNSFSVSVPQAGEASLILDLSEPSAIRCYVESGSAIPDEVSEFVWVSGIDDNIVGGWTFDNSLALYNEDDKLYAGVMNVNSAWGYLLYEEYDNWGSAIGTDDEGTAEAGNLAGGGKNIPAPEAGLHMVMADMKNLAYSTFEVTSVACTGFNDEWALIEMTQDAENPGLFTATVNISSFAWGFHLVLNNEWGYKYGGKDGVIYYNGQNMEDDKALAENPGEYTLTVDIVKRTYSLK